MTELLDSLLRGAAVTARFSRDATLQGMLDFEAALAAAEAEAGRKGFLLFRSDNAQLWRGCAAR